MDIKEETEVVKKQLAELIIKHLREKKISAENARKLASDFLQKLPFRDQKDLLAKLEELGQKSLEVREIYIEELVKEEKEKTQNTLIQMRSHIEKGNIDEAVNSAKSLSLRE